VIIQERLAFLRNAVDDPGVGAVTMSSSYVVRAVLRTLPANVTTVVEHGAGTGSLTRRLLQLLPPHGRLYAVERSPAFAEHLSGIADSRLTVVKRSVEDLSYKALGIGGHVDAIVSSIPFSFVSTGDRRGIVAAAHQALRPEGVFSVFHQYSLLMRGVLCESFAAVRVTFEPRNVFPCFILQATKRRR